MVKKTSGFSEEEKVKIRNQLVRDTGFPLKRVENYLQRFNWDLKKLYDYPIVKSAVKKTKQEKAKSKALEDIQIPQDIVPVAAYKLPKKSRKTSSVADKIGNVIDVHDDGTKWFRGKMLVNDSCALYAPYLTMEEIMAWTRAYLKVEVPVSITKLEDFNKKHKTKYRTWDDLSKNEDMRESDLIEYENYVNWHIYMKRHNIEEFSKKFQKKMRDHLATKDLGLA